MRTTLLLYRRRTTMFLYRRRRVHERAAKVPEWNTPQKARETHLDYCVRSRFFLEN